MKDKTSTDVVKRNKDAEKERKRRVGSYHIMIACNFQIRQCVINYRS